jgi:hypothetical protein
MGKIYRVWAVWRVISKTFANSPAVNPIWFATREETNFATCFSTNQKLHLRNDTEEQIFLKQA